MRSGQEGYAGKVRAFQNPNEIYALEFFPLLHIQFDFRVGLQVEGAVHRAI
jgi:hypothetical protein